MYIVYLIGLIAVTEVDYFGTDYKLDDYIMINDNIAIKIVQIFISQKEEVVAITGLRHSIHVDMNVRMYRIDEALFEDCFVLSSFKFPPVNVIKCKQNMYIKKKSF